MAPKKITFNSDQDQQKIILNISGQQFVTTTKTLLKHPNTRLGKLAAASQKNHIHFIESDPEIFKEVLKFYWTGTLHCPRNICFADFESHLDFWEIDVSFVSECCLGDMKEEASLKRQFDFFDRRIRQDPELAKSTCCRGFCYAVWCLMTDPSGPDTKYRTASKVWAVIYLFMTLSSGLTYACSTLPAFWVQSDTNETTNNSATTTTVPTQITCEEYFEMRNDKIQLMFIDVVTAYTAFFLIEIIIRFVSCPHKTKFLMSVNALDAFVVVVELISGFYFMYLRMEFARNIEKYEGVDIDKYCQGGEHLENLHVFVGQLRLFRLLSYASIYDGLKVLLITLYRSWKEIVLLMVLLAMAILICAPCVYFFSGNSISSPKSINSIPRAYWFVLVTMTTVGYGDIYPTEFGGYTATAIVMIIGLMVTALPVAIIGGNFTIVYEYNQKRVKQKLKDARLHDKVNDLTGVTSTSQDMDKLSITSVQAFNE